MNSFRYWFALHPDLPRPIGGVKQVHRLAEALSDLGRQATIVQEEASFHPGWFRSNVSTVGLSDLQRRTDLDPANDIFVLPETFINVLEHYFPAFPKLIFNQNGGYSFGLAGGANFPQPAAVLQLYRHPRVAHVLCVSKHDQHLLEMGFGLPAARVSRLVNAIEIDTFLPSNEKRLAIAFMPRKHGHDAAAVAALLQQRGLLERWQLVPIQGRPQAEVASLLQQCLVFMAFGHPEGFGLPLAEAIACACWPIGYSGLGGRELFALAARHGVGQEVAYGDWLAFVEAVAALDHQVRSGAEGLGPRLLAASQEIRDQYSAAAMRESVAIALSRWEAQLSSPDSDQNG